MHALSSSHVLDRAATSSRRHHHSGTNHHQLSNALPTLHTARHTATALPHQTHTEAHLDLGSTPSAHSRLGSRVGTHQRRELYQLADSSATPRDHAHNPLAELAATNPAGLAAAAAALGLTTFGLVKLFNRGSRSYSNNVGQE